MALFASGIKLTDQLRDPLTAINQGAQDKLQMALGKIGTRQTASNRVMGRPQGTYAPQALKTAGETASTGIKDSLLGALGQTSYDEHLKQQEQERNLALANEIGDLSAPSILEQVLGGLSGGAKAGGQLVSLYQALNKGGGGSSSSPRLSLYDPGSSGYTRYS